MKKLFYGHECLWLSADEKHWFQKHFTIMWYAYNFSTAVKKLEPYTTYQIVKYLVTQVTRMVATQQATRTDYRMWSHLIKI